MRGETRSRVLCVACAVSLLVLLSAAPAAPAAITGTSGTQIRQIVGEGLDLTTNQQSDILAFNEKQDVVLGESVHAEITRCPAAYPCTYDAPEEVNANTDTDLPPGVVVDSHLLHLNTSQQNQTRTGCVSFDSDVIAVILYSGSLTSSESANDDGDPNTDRITSDLGKPGVTYATSTSAPDEYTHRGVELSTNDSVQLGADRRSVCVSFFDTTHMDEIRVLTAGVKTLDLVASDPGAGNSRCATAKVKTQAIPDAPGAGADPAPGVSVRFKLTGPNAGGASAVTDADGNATHCYVGTTPKQDKIEAFADIDADTALDPGELAYAALAGEAPPDQPPGDQPPGDQPPGDQPPGDQPPGDQPPGNPPDDPAPPGPPGGDAPELPGGAPPDLKAEEPPAKKPAWLGTDTKPPPGSVCTRSGTSRNDRIVGTKRSDVICGRGGNDVIEGLGGDDYVYGGRGRDTLIGGNGNDHLYGGSSEDLVDGGAGNDELYGGPGRDRLLGGSGTDGAFLTEKGDRQSSVEKRSRLATANVLALVVGCQGFGGYYGRGEIRADDGVDIEVTHQLGDWVKVYGAVQAWNGAWQVVYSPGWAPVGTWLYLRPGRHSLNYFVGLGLDGRTYHTVSYWSYFWRERRMASRGATIVGPLRFTNRGGDYWCR